jgi:hypothetical protein
MARSLREPIRRVRPVSVMVAPGSAIATIVARSLCHIGCRRVLCGLRPMAVLMLATVWMLAMALFLRAADSCVARSSCRIGRRRILCGLRPIFALMLEMALLLRAADICAADLSARNIGRRARAFMMVLVLRAPFCDLQLLLLVAVATALSLEGGVAVRTLFAASAC